MTQTGDDRRGKSSHELTKLQDPPESCAATRMSDIRCCIDAALLLHELLKPVTSSTCMPGRISYSKQLRSCTLLEVYTCNPCGVLASMHLSCMPQLCCWTLLWHYVPSTMFRQPRLSLQPKCSVLRHADSWLMLQPAHVQAWSMGQQPVRAAHQVLPQTNNAENA